MVKENVIKRGNAYYLKYDDSFGHETAVGRPALVVSDEELFARRNCVVVVLMTTSHRAGYGVVDVSTRTKSQYILCDQIRVVDKDRLSTFMCEFDDKTMERVDIVLTRLLGLQPLSGEEPSVTTEVVKHDDVAKNVSDDLYARLYAKAMADLVEARYKLDELQLKYDREKRVVVEQIVPVVETMTEALEVAVVEPVDRDEDIPEALGKCSGANKKKKKRWTRKEIEKILIENGETVPPGVADTFGKMKRNPKAKPLKVNTATREELKNLGMGNHIIDDIMRHRRLRGEFTCFEELLELPYFKKGAALVFGPYLEF